MSNTKKKQQQEESSSSSGSRKSKTTAEWACKDAFHPKEFNTNLRFAHVCQLLANVCVCLCVCICEYFVCFIYFYMHDLSIKHFFFLANSYFMVSCLHIYSCQHLVIKNNNKTKIKTQNNFQ